MTVVELREGDPWTVWTLTTAQAEALRSAKLAEAKRVTGTTDRWELKAKTVVGAARVGPAAEPVTVRIRPKIPIRRLLFLIGYADHFKGWQDEEVDAGQESDLLPAVAYAFARAAERALRPGVLLGYREMEEPLPMVRGRIRETEQIRRRYGRPLPVEVRYDDFTVDIAENRLLLTAAYRLLRLTGVGEETRRMLRRLILRLDGVTPHTHGALLPRWRPSRLNARYHTALGLAELVLRSGSYEHEDGTVVRVDGLLLTMWKVFEDFLTKALAEALLPHGGWVHLQDEDHHLDHDRRVQLRPDLVYYTEAGSPGAVLDAKYAVEGSISKRQGHLYQVLAYCTALKVRRGYLIYAMGPGEPQIHRVAGTEGVQIIERSLDLTANVARLRQQIDQLAHELVGGGLAVP